MSNISHNLAQVQANIRQISDDLDQVPPRLLAVSKTQPIETVQEAVVAGQRDFGENYAQELENKARHFANQGLNWHFIGPIQSNKTRVIAEYADWVHSIERTKIATRLNDQRPSDRPALNVCIQVNIDNEATKSGVSAELLPELIKHIHALPKLELVGLMAIPGKQAPEHAFKKMASLARDFDLRELSMGMSGDMPQAIAAGSTIVRVGTAIFGPRRDRTAQ